MGSIRNKNNWNNASKRLFGSYSHSGIPGFHSGYSAPRSKIAGIYSGIHSYSGIFPNERALRPLELANSTKVSSDFRLAFFPQFSRCSNVSVGTNLGRRLKSLVKAESAVGNLLLWLVAIVSISTETFNKSLCNCFNLVTQGQDRRLKSFPFHSGSSL